MKNLIIIMIYGDPINLALNVLFILTNITQSMERWMRSFLINKNLSLYYWLRKRIGKKWAFGVVNITEKAILILGRTQIPDNEWIRIDKINKS